MRHVGRKRAIGIVAAVLGGALPVELAWAKVPGQVHCYGRVCHRVLSVGEVRDIVGRTFDTVASFYDAPERDRFNAGVITSSGERFDAWSPQRVASSIYPDGTELLLWNPRNGRAAHVRVNDFGPFYARRTLDVTRRIAEDLGFAHSGVAVLKVVVVAAPSAAEARHRKGRRYTRAYGFIGSYTIDDLDDVAADLIADAEHNRLQVAARTEPRSSLVMPPTGRHWLTWAQRVALARAESSLSATSELLLAVARAAAERSRDVLMSRNLLVPADDARLVPAIVAASAAPDTVITSADAPGNRPLESAAPSPGPVVLPATAAALPTQAAALVVADAAEASVRGLLNDDLATAEAGAPASTVDALADALSAITSGVLADTWTRWMAALLLATNLLLFARLARERRPVTARGASIARVTTYAGGPRAAMSPDAVDPRNLTNAGSRILPPALAGRPAPDVVDLARHGRDLMSNGNAREAEALFRIVVCASEQAFGADAPEITEPLADLAEAVGQQGRIAEAMALYDRALATVHAHDRASGSQTAEVLEARALLRIRGGDAKAAVGDAARAVALRGVARAAASSTALAMDPDFGVSLSILGEAHRLSGDGAAAESAHRQALAHFISREGSAGLRSAGSMTSLAEVLMSRGRTAEARSLLLAALPILEARLGLRHPGVARSRETLAGIHRAQGDIDEAVRLRRQSLSILESVDGRAHPDVRAARGPLAALIKAAGVGAAMEDRT